VRDVFVDGRQVVADRKVLALDQDDAADHLTEAQQRIIVWRDPAEIVTRLGRTLLWPSPRRPPGCANTCCLGASSDAIVTSSLPPKAKIRWDGVGQTLSTPIRGVQFTSEDLHWLVPRAANPQDR
jgi:hypothetical protein